MNATHSPAIGPAIGPGAALAVGALLGTGWVAARSVIIPAIWLRIRNDRATRVGAAQGPASRLRA